MLKTNQQKRGEEVEQQRSLREKTAAVRQRLNEYYKTKGQERQYDFTGCKFAQEVLKPEAREGTG